MPSFVSSIPKTQLTAESPESNEVPMSDLPTPDSIRSAAAAVGLSPFEMCRRAHVSQSIFTRWVQGSSPRLSTVEKWQAVIRDAAGASQSKGTEDAAKDKDRD
jgi:hypothetical protein